MTIIQISATSSGGRHGGFSVLGLGDDQKVYIWDPGSHEWKLFN